jgi:3-oxoacyl-[acyl-carrier protein] reductase
MTYKGKVALVTGGTGALGQVIVHQLLDLGLQVAFTYHQNQDKAQELMAAGTRETVWALQVSKNDLAEARTLVETLSERWGPVDYLVNCVGAVHDSMFVKMEPEQWQASIEINLQVPYTYARAVFFDMLKRQGAIVNIASIAGITGSPGQANYATAKAGMLGLTKSLAREGGRLGVRVNAIAPGYIVSPMTEQIPQKIKDQALQLIPLARFGEPQDVANAVAFLLSDEARYITGQTLTVDGGLVM